MEMSSIINNVPIYKLIAFLLIIYLISNFTGQCVCVILIWPQLTTADLQSTVDLKSIFIDLQPIQNAIDNIHVNYCRFLEFFLN